MYAPSTVNNNNRQMLSPSPTTCQLPLTPPISEDLKDSVHEVLEAFRQHKAGSLKISLQKKIKISPQQYHELVSLLEKDKKLRAFVSDKVRYNYDPLRHCLTICMPTVLHDTFIAGIRNDVQKDLDNFAQSEPELREPRRLIKNTGSGEIKLFRDETPVTKQCPDEAYIFIGANYPRVVMEMAYSQTQKGLAEVAENYIIGSCSAIATVIGFDIEYGRRGASVLCWKPYIEVEDGEEVGVCKQVINKPFRAASGPCDGELLIPLQYFLPTSFASNPTAEKLSVRILFSRLAAILDEAEEVYRTMEGMTGSTDLAFHAKSWRKRKRTPTPEPSEDADDAEIESVKRRQEELDEDYIDLREAGGG